MERWKKFLESSGADMWTVCERALTVAYMEEPHNFWIGRDKLAQKLFAPEKLDLQAVQQDLPGLTAHAPAKEQDPKCIAPDGAYDEAEILTDEMEEEVLVKRSVLSIKEILQDSYLSEKEILDSLQRLDLMELSVDVLKDTEIGKTVNNLRKNPSRQVRLMVKQLVRGWKELVDEWVKSAQVTTAAATSETLVSDSQDNVNEEHGLPSPPMDEGALLTSRVEMSQLFDFIEGVTSAGSGGSNSPEHDLQQSARVDKVKPSDASYNLPDFNTISKESRQRENSMTRDKNTLSDLERKVIKEQGTITITNGCLGKAVANSNKSNCNDSNVRTNTSANERKPQTGSVEKSAGSLHNPSVHVLKSGGTLTHRDDIGYDEKIQATKRKLQKTYEQAENAKKQRTTQVMDLQNLPKGGPNPARSYQAHGKHGSQPRPFATGRNR